MWESDRINPDKPKYLAIADALESDIVNGKVVPGEQLPPQRELAENLSVNLSTVSRAYREAEKRGLTAGTVGRGTFVSADVSVKRELVPIEEQQSGHVEMGLVLPLYQHDPDLQQRVIKLASQHDLASYTRYSEPFGLPEHLEIGAQWVQKFGFTVSPDLVMVTAGAQHALTCAFASCFKPGSRIAVDHLTYPGIKALASMMHIRLMPIEMDTEGMIPEQLEIACRSNTIEGIYLMPCCHNPTGVAMSEGRREKIAALIKKHHLLLLEDDAYYFTAQVKKPALSTQLPDNSIFIGGFSKILFAGLRSAFVVTSPKIRKKLTRAVLNTIWMAPTFNTSILCDAIEDGTINTVIAAKQEEAKLRNIIVKSLLSFCSTTSSTGAFFQWCKLPSPWTALSFEEQARKKGVNVFCGEKFSVGNKSIEPYIRIAITSPETKAALSTGLTLLNEVIEDGIWPLSGIN